MFELKLYPCKRNGKDAWLSEPVEIPENRPFISCGEPKKFMHFALEVHKWLEECNIKYELHLSRNSLWFYTISFNTPEDAILFKLVWL